MGPGGGPGWPDFQGVSPGAHASLGLGSLLLSQDPPRFDQTASGHAACPSAASVGSAFAGFSIRDFPPWTGRESLKIIHEKLMAVFPAGGFAGREHLVVGRKRRESILPESHSLAPPAVPEAPPQNRCSGQGSGPRAQGQWPG